MRDLIDTPIYTTTNISHIHGWSTAYVRKGLSYRLLWNPEDLNIVQKIDNQIVASYRDFIFLDIFHFFTEKGFTPKRRSSLLHHLAKNEDLFYKPEFELATDGAEVFRKQSFGQEIYDGVNIETMQISFLEFFEPILERRIFSAQKAVFSWQIDAKFPDIIIHPAIAFGKPHIRGHRIKSELLFDIHTARKASAKEIAQEYEIENISLVQQAINFEMIRNETQKAALH